MKLVKLEWGRGKSMPTEISNRTVWFSKCGKYAIAKWMPSITGLHDFYQSLIVRDGVMYEIIGKAKTRVSAERICKKHATLNQQGTVESGRGRKKKEVDA